jgi:uncharacterized protein YdaL
MSSTRIFKIVGTAQIFIASRPTIAERSKIKDCLYPLVHKIQPYKESEGIYRIAPQFYKFVTEKYTYYFNVLDTKLLEIADIKYTNT